MKTDILTVVWKERQGLFRVRGRRTQAVLTMLSPIFMGIYMPWSMGVDWLEGGMSVFLSVIVPFILVGITVPDSFAGERERHTLPTLLASRLSDRAILFGKLATSVAFGCGIMLVVLLLSLVTVNIVHWDGHIVLYRPTVILADLAVSFLIALLTASLGVLISLRSSTVQQAQQTLMAVLLLPAMALQVAAMLLMGSEAGEARLREVLSTLSFDQVILVVVAILVAIDLASLLAAMSRFRRSRLILS